MLPNNLKINSTVKIVEVGPRDGLQNETQIIQTQDKIHLIEMLAQTGLKNIEATSFVRPEKIPQMADAATLCKLLNNKIDKNISLSCLVPNQKGLDLALEAGVREVAIFSATSETFNKKNINATIDESLDRIRPVAIAAMKNGIKVRGYISTVFGCPYEGQTSLEILKKVANRLFDFGVYEISFGDTIGVANPLQVKKIISELKNHFDLAQMAMHFHDTRGLAVANVFSSFQEGISIFDSSVGGLGGCPYAIGASGNVATEDLVYLFDSMHIHTGIDMAKLMQASQFILQKLGRSSPSKFHHAYVANQARN